jgi:Flp pilus assembly protein TadB
MADEIYDVTNAQPGLSGDQEARQKRYFFSMMLRTLCFVLAVVTPSPFRWFFLAGAIGLPYIAVVIANAGRETMAPGRAVMKEKRRSIS